MQLNIIQRATFRLAQAAKGNPITTTFVVLLFYMLFNFLFYVVEKLFFGAPFVHFMDIVLSMSAITYAAYAVFWCAIFNSQNSDKG